MTAAQQLEPPRCAAGAEGFAHEGGTDSADAARDEDPHQDGSAILTWRISGTHFG